MMKPLKAEIGRILNERFQMAKRRISDGKNEPQSLSAKKKLRSGRASKTPATSGAKGASSLSSSSSSQPAVELRCEQTRPGSSIANPIDLTETCASDEDKMDHVIHGRKHLLDDGFDPRWAFPDDAMKDISPSQIIRDYGTKMMSIKCGVCMLESGTKPASVATPSNAPAEIKELCDECRNRFCFNCGTYANNFTESDRHKRFECCKEARLMVLFSLLCVSDTANPADNDDNTEDEPNFVSGRRKRDLSFREFIARLKKKFKSKMAQGESVPEQGDTAAPQNPKALTPSAVPVPAASSAFAKGTGYGGRRAELATLGASGSKPSKSSSYGIPNGQLETHFKSLAAVLPPQKRPTGNPMVDREHEARNRLLVAMISRSPLILAALELLRNDSMEEIARKASLYGALLDFLGVVAGHPKLRWTLLVAQRLYSLPQQLAGLAFSEAAQDDSSAETTSSVALTMEKMGSYCDFLISKALKHARDFTEGQGKDQLELAHRIRDLARTLTAVRKAAEPKRSSRSGREGGNWELNPGDVAKQHQAKAAAAWHAEHSVEEIPDDEFWASFSFAKDAKNMSDGSVCKGRMKKLIIQLASLRTGLPEGIYARHPSSRLDVLKVLFVGPSGTPYEGGLFEFDVFCGADFPNKPPRVRFRTTGNGTVRFNPNLYPCGKVCLSLLGTWNDGQKWIAGESTLEQLFVSIQGMILCEQPWYNEPGFEHSPNQKHSDHYNRTIQQSTVYHAMIHWLRERLRQEEATGSGTRARLQAPASAALKGPPAAGFPEEFVMNPFSAGLEAAADDLFHPHGTETAFFGSSSAAASAASLAAASAASLAAASASLAAASASLAAASASSSAAASSGTILSPSPSKSKSTPSAKTACKEDDKIWGPVIRHHFASYQGILPLVKKWESGWGRGNAYSRELERLLRNEKYIG